MDLKTFRERIDDWMIKDIRLALSPAIKDGMNFASVILIFVGMDFMGSFLTGKGKPTKDNVIRFLEEMSITTGNEMYRKMKLCLYNGFRNGLIHNYFAGKPKFVINIKKLTNNGISYPDAAFHLQYKKYLSEGSIHINIYAYCLFNDFKITVNNILDQIENQSQEGIYFNNYSKRWQELMTQAKDDFEQEVLDEINNLK